jgi:hypothetical protein
LLLNALCGRVCAALVNDDCSGVTLRVSLKRDLDIGNLGEVVFRSLSEAPNVGLFIFDRLPGPGRSGRAPEDCHVSGQPDPGDTDLGRCRRDNAARPGLNGLGSEQRRDALDEGTPTGLREPDQEEPVMCAWDVFPRVRKIEVLRDQKSPDALSGSPHDIVWLPGEVLVVAETGQEVDELMK